MTFFAFYSTSSANLKNKQANTVSLGKPSKTAGEISAVWKHFLICNQQYQSIGKIETLIMELSHNSVYTWCFNKKTPTFVFFCIT